MLALVLDEHASGGVTEHKLASNMSVSLERIAYFVLAPNAKLRRQVIAFGAAEPTSAGPPRDRPQIVEGLPAQE